MILTVAELKKSLSNLNDKKFIIVNDTDNKQDLIIDRVDKHYEEGSVWCYEIKCGSRINE